MERARRLRSRLWRSLDEAKNEVDDVKFVSKPKATPAPPIAVAVTRWLPYSDSVEFQHSVSNRSKPTRGNRSHCSAISTSALAVVTAAWLKLWPSASFWPLASRWRLAWQACMPSHIRLELFRSSLRIRARATFRPRRFQIPHLSPRRAVLPMFSTTSPRSAAGCVLPALCAPRRPDGGIFR